MLIGEPMVIFYANDYGSLAEVSQFTKGLAGAEVNVGIGLSRLGHEVSYLTKLSNDELGKYIFEYLQKEKFDLTHTQISPNLPVGVMYKNKVKTGDPETLYYRKGSAASTLNIEDVKGIDFSQLKLLHLTGIPLALSESLREVSFYLIKEARKHGCLITFDPNLRPSLWESEELMIQTINEIALLADVFLPGLGEAQLLTGLTEITDISNYYLERGVSQIVIKDGGKGAFIQSRDQKGQMVDGFKVESIIDTVGAGDGFAVGIVDGLLRGLSLAQGCENANAIGAIQIQDASDNEALPTLAELTHFKETYNR